MAAADRVEDIADVGIIEQLNRDADGAAERAVRRVFAL